MSKVLGLVLTAGVVSVAASILAEAAMPVLVLSAAGFILASWRWHS